MALTVSLLGVNYSVPEPNDTGYDQQLTNYLKALATAFPQLSGGTYSLTAELDLGSSFGVKSLYLKSETANPASAGLVRYAKSDSAKWRNNANSADLALAIDTADALTFNGANVTGNPLLGANTAAGQSFTSGAVTIVVYGTVEVDTDSGYNSGTGRYTVPTGKAGHYQVIGQAIWNATPGANSEIAIYKNAASVKSLIQPTGAAFLTMQIGAVLNLAAGDIIDIRLTQSSGGPVVLQNQAIRNFFALKRIPT